MHFIFTARLYHLTRFPSATTVTIRLLCMLSLYNTQSLLLCTDHLAPDSPDSDFSNCMDKLQEMINDHSKDDRHSDVYVIGDFNMPVFNWEESAVSTNPPNGAYQRLMTFLSPNQVLTHAARAAASRARLLQAPLVAARGAREGLWLEQTFLEVNFLTQVVKEPTRGPNILDLILTSKSQRES